MIRSLATTLCGLALSGCGPPPPGSIGPLCAVTNRTPLSEASHWAGPTEQDLLDTIATQSPIQVGWDELVLDSASSPVSVTVAWDAMALEVIERDCSHDPLLLIAPSILYLNLGEGGVTGELDGELRATPEGALSVRTEGEVEVVEPWASVGQDYVEEEGVQGELEAWRATVKGPWEEAEIRLDVVNIDEEGEDWVTSLWHGQWVTEAARR